MTKQTIDNAFDEKFKNLAVHHKHLEACFTDHVALLNIQSFLHSTIPQILYEVVGEKIKNEWLEVEDLDWETRTREGVDYDKGYNLAKDEILNRIKNMGYERRI